MGERVIAPDHGELNVRPEIGVCEIDPEDGYCVATLARQPAREMPGVGCLDTGPVWVTNLSEAGIRRLWVPEGIELREESWGRTPLRGLSAELGLDMQPQDLRVGVLADILDSAVEIASRCDLPVMANDLDLVDACCRALPRTSVIVADDGFDDACRQASRGWVPVRLAPQMQWCPLTLHWQRARRTQALLRAKAPVGPWRRLEASERPGSIAEIIAGPPMLLLARVEGRADTWAELMPWWINREAWVASPEVGALPAEATIRVLDGYIAESYSDPVIAMGTLTRRDTLHPGLGVLLDSVAAALVARDPYHPEALFTSARDRAACVHMLRYAKRLGLPIEVISYGQGRIHIGIDTDHDEDVPGILAAWVANTEWVPPSMSANPLQIGSPTDGGAVAVLQALALAGRTDLMIKPLKAQPPRLAWWSNETTVGREGDVSACRGAVARLQEVE